MTTCRQEIHLVDDSTAGRLPEDKNSREQQLLADNEALGILTNSLADDNQHLRGSIVGLVRALHGLAAHTTTPPLSR